MQRLECTEQRLFTIQDAAKYLCSIGAFGVTPYTVRGLIASGQLAHIRLGRRFFVTRAAMEAWLASHEKRMR